MFKKLLLLASGSILSALFGAIALKLIALTLGPSGTGLFGLFRQTQTTVVLLGSFSGQQALTQGIASKESNDRNTYLKTVAYIFLIGVLLSVVTLLVFTPFLKSRVFGFVPNITSGEIRWLALPVVLGIGVAFFSAVLAGNSNIKGVVSVQIFTTLGLMVAANPMSRIARSGAESALIHILTISLGLGLIVGVVATIRSKALAFDGFLHKPLIDKSSALHFTRIAGVMFLTTIVNNVILVLVRSLIAETHGTEGGGYFDAAWTISNMYITFMISVFNAYFFPKLSAAKNAEERELILNQLVRWVSAGLLLLLTPIIVLKIPLLHLLYSAKYDPTVPIMRWMALGDFLRCISWIFGISLLAQAKMKPFLISELLFNLGFLILGLPAILKVVSLEYTGAAYFVTNIALLQFLSYHAIKIDKVNILNRQRVCFAISGGFIAMCSAFLWNQPQPGIVIGAITFGGALFLLFSFLEQSERNRLKDLIRKGTKL